MSQPTDSTTDSTADAGAAQPDVPAEQPPERLEVRDREPGRAPERSSGVRPWRSPRTVTATTILSPRVMKSGAAALRS